MNIFIVGLGLIGASYASRLTELKHTVYGMDNNQDITMKALRDGCIVGNDVKYMYDADIVIIALYPEAILTFIEDHAAHFKPNQIITDVSGVKANIVSSIEHQLPASVHYVSHHPMAGKEISGYDARDARLFDNSNAIIIKTETTDVDASITLKTLLKAMGFTSCIMTSPDIHDSLIAHTSQLPHILAMVLVDIGRDDEVYRYTGNSFRDLTRIASINAALWSELFLSNREALSTLLDDTIESLRNIQTLIKENQVEKLISVMTTVKEKRDRYANNSNKNI